MHGDRVAKRRIKRVTYPLVAKNNKKKIIWNGESVRELRYRLKLTQKELAGKLGTRQQTISEWETNMYQPRGTSSKLLSIVAERAKFKYETTSEPGIENPESKS